MAYTVWRGAGVHDAPLESGNYEDGLNWTRGDPPGSEDIADLPQGDYTVTLSRGASIGRLYVGAGVTFRFQGGNGVLLELGDQSSNSGILRADAGVVALGGAFLNYGTFIGDGTSSDDRMVRGTLINHGLVTKADADYAIDSTLDNQSDGVVRATQGDALTLLGTVSNAGLFDADGSTIRLDDLRGTASLANLQGTTLLGGQWRAANGGTIQLAGPAIQALGAGADVVLERKGATFTMDDGAGFQSLDASLRTVAAGAELHLLGRRGFGGDQDLDVRGTLEFRGGVLQVGELAVLRDAVLTGFGTVDGAGDLSGSVSIVGGALRFTDDVTIAGAVSGRTLALGGRDNAIGPDAQVTVGTLALEGGITRVGDGSLHARNLAVHDATLDLGGSGLTLTGTLDLDGGRVNGDAALRLTGDHLTSLGEATFGVDVVNLGAISVAADRLTFERRLSGAGAVTVEDGATLAFGAGAVVTRAQSIELAGASSLSDAAPAGFAATLSGFGAGDVVTLGGLAADATRVRWVADADGSGGTLTLIGDTSRTTLRFADGGYGRRDFVVSAAGDGCVALTYQAHGHASVDVAAAFGPDAHGATPEHGFGPGWLHPDAHVALV